MLNQFWGGTTDGKCLQITGNNKLYVSLTKQQARELAAALVAWTEDRWPEQDNTDVGDSNE